MFALRAFIVALCLALLPISAIGAQAAPPAVDPVAEAATRLTTLNTQLAQLTPYIGQQADGAQYLDRNAAAAAGFSESLLDLAAQIVAYQNSLQSVQQAMAASSGLDTASYPMLAALFSDASTVAAARDLQTAQAGGDDPVLDVTAAHPCGDLAHPVPNANPPRVLVGPDPAAVDTLMASGYHRTAGYVCGAPEGEACGYDYTRGRDYWGPYGWCPPPALRDQATLSSAHSTESGKAYWLQEGEPNPEINDYDWPYWNWASYVTWWHNQF